MSCELACILSYVEKCSSYSNWAEIFFAVITNFIIDLLLEKCKCSRWSCKRFIELIPPSGWAAEGTGTQKSSLTSEQCFKYQQRCISGASMYFGCALSVIDNPMYLFSSFTAWECKFLTGNGKQQKTSRHFISQIR